MSGLGDVRLGGSLALPKGRGQAESRESVAWVMFGSAGASRSQAGEGVSAWAEAEEVIQRIDAVVGFVLSFASLLILSMVPVLVVV